MSKPRYINVDLSPEDYARFRLIATEKDTNPTALCRDLIAQAIERDREEKIKKIQSHCDVVPEFDTPSRELMANMPKKISIDL